MKTFSINIYSATQSEQIDNVVSFVGEDLSGSFGILADHVRMMTCLKFGLARFSYSSEREEYIALPGGILYFINNKLRIATMHYLRSTDYQKIAVELEKQMAQEETDAANIKEILHNLDETVLKRLWELSNEGTT